MREGGGHSAGDGMEGRGAWCWGEHRGGCASEGGAGKEACSAGRVHGKGCAVLWVAWGRVHGAEETWRTWQQGACGGKDALSEERTEKGSTVQGEAWGKGAHRARGK